MEVATPLALQPTVDIMLTVKARFRLIDFSRHLKDADVKYSMFVLAHQCPDAFLHVCNNVHYLQGY